MGLKASDRADYLELYVGIVDEFINGEASSEVAQSRLDDLNTQYDGKVSELFKRIRGADRLEGFWESSQC